ncbi:MAG TPA: DUF4097 family beta strand repeat-containing protein [Candidatus Acidoferrales bacterium]|nr:DUF4097 family beta strand repeat-containing protein [Candidatus Acidoferrales bacterium]
MRETTSLQSRTHSCVHSKSQPPRRLPSLARIFLAFAAVCLLALPGFADEQQVFEQTYPLPSGGQFILQNVNGSVRVEGWNRNEVEVRAVKTSETDSRDLALVKIQVDSHPGEVDVHTLYPDGEDAAVAVEYVIHVPFRVLLHSIVTVNGSVSVHGVQGAGELRSVNGNVEVLNSSGRFSARTTNGNLHLELSNLTDGAPMNLETVNGSVTLGLPSNASADLNVRNMNGDVSSDVPVYSTAAIPGAQAFRGRLGHGGNPISVRTVNGGIRLLLEHPGV